MGDLGQALDLRRVQVASHDHRAAKRAFFLTGQDRPRGDEHGAFGKKHDPRDAALRVGVAQEGIVSQMFL